MPEQTSVTVYASAVGAISTIMGLIVGGSLALIGKGKRDERLDASLRRCHERLDEHEETFKTQNQALKAILASFFDDKGEPRYITRIVCGEKEGACQSVMHEKMSALEDNLNRLEIDVLAVKTAQDNNLQTILNEIRLVNK